MICKVRIVVKSMLTEEEQALIASCLLKYDGPFKCNLLTDGVELLDAHHKDLTIYAFSAEEKTTVLRSSEQAVLIYNSLERDRHYCFYEFLRDFNFAIESECWTYSPFALFDGVYKYILETIQCLQEKDCVFNSTHRLIDRSFFENIEIRIPRVDLLDEFIFYKLSREEVLMKTSRLPYVPEANRDLLTRLNLRHLSVPYV